MISENPVKTVPTYATESLYMTPPNQEQIRNGVIPLDSLPAPWWNWLWNQLTINEGQTVNALNDILTELHNVLQSAGITPSQMDSSQLRQAIVKISQTVGTSTTPGSVISSSVPGKVSIAADGTMTANGLGNINDLNTDVATSIVNAINWLYRNTTDKIGALTDLQTSDKTNLVSAINSNKVANDNTNTIIGSLSSLATTVKTSIIEAINWLYRNTTDKIGALTDLQTSDKTNLVSAINSNKVANDNTNTIIGSLSSLATTVKTSIIEAINWLYKNTSDKIGALTDLQTSDKTNLVSAINSNKTANDNTNTIIGTLSSLTAAVKTSIVSAINSIVDGATKVAKAALADVASKVGHTLTINGVTFDGSADKSITINAATVQGDILKKIFKVGAYYITENSENPATTFGFGTWVELTEGRGIIQSGSSYTPGSEGGSNSVALSTANMPSHTHPFTPGGNVGAHNHPFTPQGTIAFDHAHLYMTGVRPYDRDTDGGVISQLRFAHPSYAQELGSMSFTIEPESEYVPNSCSQEGFGTWVTRALPAGTLYNYTVLDHQRGAPYASTLWAKTGRAIDQNEPVQNYHEAAYYIRKTLSGTRTNTESVAPTFTGVRANTAGAGSGTSFSVLNAYRAAHIWRRTA